MTCKFQSPSLLDVVGRGGTVLFFSAKLLIELASPRWQGRSVEYNKLAIHKLRERASPVQTQWLGRGDVKIPRKLARPRFTTKYHEQFLD